MLPPFRAGVGGPLGSGRQGMSWIALDDLLGVIHRALRDERCHGPINAVAPEPCSNAAFTKALARVLRRPAILPVPAAALRMAFGELANETLLADSRVRPSRLLALHHRFLYPELPDALAHVLGRTGRGGRA
jgi:NAD dependent epimerase/dehydratase family enzyme